MLTRTLALCSAGLVAGIVLVLACSDDSPSVADAAPVCDCPEAEPPLAGRIVLEEHPINISPGAGASGGANCDQVDGVFPQVLSGGCRIVDDTARVSGDMKLLESHKKLGLSDEDRWTCTYDNATGTTVQGMITLTCLQPAPAE
jgi:hypothetical protein